MVTQLIDLRRLRYAIETRILADKERKEKEAEAQMACCQGTRAGVSV